jgi:hypothetical protein
MKKSGLVFALMLIGSVFGGAQCNAQDNPDTQNLNDARYLRFQNIFASRRGDQRLYILLGGGFIRVLSFGSPGAFISDWLAAHPTATVTPISRRFTTNTITRKTAEMVYIWVEDREHSLNVDMVRAGLFPGDAMYDMVDHLNGLNQLLQDPELADARAQIEKERAAAPQDLTGRLITENDYKERVRRIDEAENQARAEKLGIWSDAMEAERQSEGYP